MGLFLYDVPFKIAYRNRVDTFWMLFIGIFSLLAIYLNAFLVIPFAIFFFIYLAKMLMVKRRISQLGNGLGMLGYSFLFVLTLEKMDVSSLILMTSLFVFMLGSEFTVRSVTTRNKAMLIYNVIPPFFTILNPVFGIFALSLGRIPIALMTRKVRRIGMIETIFLLVVVVTLEYFYVLRF